MMTKSVKNCCIVFLLALICSVSAPSPALAETADLDLKEKDRVVLSAEIGKGKGELGYPESFVGGAKGPDTFAVSEDETVYISDNINDRINVYRDGKFLYDIETPYAAYIKSIAISDELIYLMDYDGAKIFAVDKKGNLVKDIDLPEDMANFLMTDLYVREDGSVWVCCMDGEEEGDDLSSTYFLVDSFSDRQRVKTSEFPVSRDDYCTIDYTDGKTISIRKSNNPNITGTDRTDDILIDTKGGDVSASILEVDKYGSVYLDVDESVGIYMFAGENTVRKYLQGKCEGIAGIDLDDYCYIPYGLTCVNKNGELYQMVCYDNKVDVIKKTFVQPYGFESRVNEIREKTLREEAKEDEMDLREAKKIINAPNDVSTTKQNAIACCNLKWTYNNANAKKPNKNVQVPTYLQNAKKPSNQIGIPYCWGGFNGLKTIKGTSWVSFLTAMKKGKFAGNIKATPSGYQTDTAGLDCSGFVSSTAGFSYKLSTTNLASSDYTRTINKNKVVAYDIFVISGKHVFFYIGYDKKIKSYKTCEATTDGTEKVKFFYRSKKELDTYKARRFNGW